MTFSFTWLGNAAYRLDADGIGPIYVDPWIEGNPSCPIGLNDIADSALVLVSHGHPGHFGNSVYVAARTGATYVTNQAVAAYVRDARLLPASQVVGLELGETRAFGPMSITLYPIAHPPQDVISFAPAEPNTASVIRVGDVTLFHAGDIGMDPAFARIGKEVTPTHAIIPLTGSDVPLAAERTLEAAMALGARTVIPTCRYTAYPERVAEFKRLSASRNAPYAILEPDLGSARPLSRDV